MSDADVWLLNPLVASFGQREIHPFIMHVVVLMIGEVSSRDERHGRKSTAVNASIFSSICTPFTTCASGMGGAGVSSGPTFSFA